MQHFQPILIAIGILAIAGVLIHGFLLNRKEKQSKLAKQQPLDDAPAIDTEPPVRSKLNMAKQALAANKQRVQPSIDLDAIEQFDDEQENLTSERSSSHVDSLDRETAEQASASTDAHGDLEDATPDTPDLAQQDSIKIVDESLDEQASEPKDLFIFNVVAKNEGTLGGHKLLQFFLTSGFRFGEMNIFHRHENSDGTGEIQFSIANMMAPGTFELDEMEQFTTKGISFFLTAPNPKISVKQSFELMLTAVVQLADEFDCDVLNEKREPLTESQFIEYRNRLQQYP